MRKLFIFVGVLVILLTYLDIGSVYAQNEFETRYDVIYDFEVSGEARITQTIEIINNERDVVATTYTVRLSDKGVTDLTTKVNGDTIKPTIEESATGINIILAIKDPVIGYNKSNIIELSYKTGSIYAHTGEISNIFVPKTLLTEGTTKYNVTVFIPKDWGPEVFVSPEPKNKTGNTTKWSYEYTKDEMQYAGINAAFGQNQTVNFDLTYELRNTGALAGTQEITLPSDIYGYQLVIIENITPQPVSIKFDADGNRKALYKIPAQTKETISVKGYAKLTTKIIAPQKGGAFTNLPKEVLKEYTSADTYWEVNSPIFKEIAQQLKDDTKTVSQNAQLAYTYIVNILTYDYSIDKSNLTTRQGAVHALTSKNQIGCMEFTDSLITLLRTMGIPAREINGYALATHLGNKQPLTLNLEGGDYLHAWLEYYDPTYGWIQIDPTWGNTSGLDYFTKLDASHFALAIKGVDSENPRPAGAFKFDSKQKQLDIAYSEVTRETPKPDIQIAKSKISIVTEIIFKRSIYKITNHSHYTVFVPETKKVMVPNESNYITTQKNETEIRIKDPLTKDYFFKLN